MKHPLTAYHLYVASSSYIQPYVSYQGDHHLSCAPDCDRCVTCGLIATCLGLLLLVPCSIDCKQSPFFFILGVGEVSAGVVAIIGHAADIVDDDKWIKGRRLEFVSRYSL